MRPVHPLRHRHDGRCGQPGAHRGEPPPIQLHRVHSPQGSYLLDLQCGIRIAENHRHQRRTGHAHRVDEGQQLAKIVQGVAQPELDLRHQPLRPTPYQGTQIFLRQPRRPPHEHGERREIRPGQRRPQRGRVPQPSRRDPARLTGGPHTPRTHRIGVVLRQHRDPTRHTDPLPRSRLPHPRGPPRRSRPLSAHTEV